MKRIFRHAPSRETSRSEMEYELAFHLQGRIDDLMARGLSREEAEIEAQRRFGNRASVETEISRVDRQLLHRRTLRDALDDALRDVRHAARGLLRRPAFSLTVIVTLALGIGANTAIFSVADALLFRAPPYPRPEQLMSMWGANAGDLFALRELTHSFTNIASYSASDMNVGDEVATTRVEGADVSANFLSTLEVRPSRGRGFLVDADKTGAPPEVLLSDALWRSQFGADTTLLGKSIVIDGIPRAVIGIMPADFHFPALSTKLWFNSTFDASKPGPHWGIWRFKFFGRLREGTTASRAQSDVRAAAIKIRKLNPLWDPGPTFGSDATVTPLKSQLSGSARTTMFVLLGVVFALLLIACANVANLVLVRSLEREREFAVRVALGCSRARLMRQLVTENLVLSALGGAAALACAWGGVAMLNSALPPQIPRTAPIAVDARVLLFTGSLALLAGLVFGLAPSFRASRAARTGGLVRLPGASRNQSAGAEHRRLADGLTVVQMALAVMMLAGAGLLLRSFDALKQVNPGFKAEQLVTGRVTLSPGSYKEPMVRAVFLRELLRRTAETAGVLSVAAVDRPPLREAVYGMPVRVAGQFEDMKNVLPTIDHTQSVSSAYFTTMEIPLKRGRGFTDADRDGAPLVAVVSESVAKRFWPNEDPIGQRVGPAFAAPWITIVGVVADVQQDSVSGTAEGTIYRPIEQTPQTDFTIIVRTRSDVSSVTSALRKAVAELDRFTPVSDVRAMDDVVASSYARARFTAILLSGFSLLALLISAVGIYGVVSSNVSQRTREMALRMALGATPASVVALVMRRGAWLTTTGIALGLIGALGATRWLIGLLYGVTATDARTYVVAPLLLLMVGLFATWIPAQRVTKDSPLTALRGE